MPVPRPSSRRPAWLLLAAFVAPIAVVRGQESPPPTSITDDLLARREEELLRQYRELERSFLRLADLLAATDPRRAALLRDVFERAREEQVGDRLTTIVELLEKGQLLKAGTSQQGSLEQFRQLLALLEAGDGDKRRATEREEVRAFLNKVTKAIAKQRDIEGSTEAGAAEAELARRQTQLADDTKALAAELDGFARRIDEAAQPEGKPSPAGADDEATPEERTPNDRPADGEPRPRPEGGEPPAADGAKPGDQPADGAEPTPGQEAQGEPSGKPGERSEGEAGEAGEPDASGRPEPDDRGDDDASRARRTKKRLQAAQERMQAARKELEAARRGEARGEQEKALQELETARAELEEILRQMREEEVERLLVQLEARVRDMLKAQKAIVSAAEKLAAESQVADRERELEATRLGRDQTAVGAAASKALALVRDDGTAVAIPQALEGIRDDATQAAARLGRGDVAGTTRGIVQDVATSLEELLAALEKAQRDQQERQEQQGRPSGGRAAEPGEQPLVDKIAELKMIRALQMRVNTRTQRFTQLLGDETEQADQPELLDALSRLAERQRKIERAARDIVTGRTE